jgi:hypothetical protein
MCMSVIGASLCGSGSLFPPEITHKTSGCGKGGKERERLQVGWTNGAQKL